MTVGGGGGGGGGDDGGNCGGGGATARSGDPFNGPFGPLPNANFQLTARPAANGTVPEPSSLALFGVALAGLAASMRCRRRQNRA